MKHSVSTPAVFSIIVLLITMSLSGCTNSSVPDPLIQNTVQVTFEITVPAYQSNELQVSVTWGDQVTNASWVGDEMWLASAELTTSTGFFIEVEFNDRNGALALAEVDQWYNTGMNALETLVITADQFEANRFDADDDGVSNLEEVIAGTDPLVDESALFEIVDSYSPHTFSTSRMSVSANFESLVPTERPFFENIELTDSTEWSLIERNIDIDSEGNGTLILNQTIGPSRTIRENYAGTRTRSENAITWEGTRNAYDWGYTHKVEFTNTVTQLDGTTSSFTEDLTGSNFGGTSDSWEISSNLTGTRLEGTSLCKPVAGTISYTLRTNRGNGPLGGRGTAVTTISKLIDDPYWRVVWVNNDSLVNGEFFARELEIYRTYGPEDSNNAYYVCDFADF